jgi:hypothetical protein
MKNELTINGLNENIAYCEAMGLSKCFEAYAEYGTSIIEGGIGFNPNSGYVYIALENDVTICSMLGRDVEYLVTDLYSGEEFFFDNTEDAENHLETLNNKFLELTKNS